MSIDSEEIIKIYKNFVEATIVKNDIDKVLSMITNDIIGIGMGEQGIVTTKQDVARILGDGKYPSEANRMVIKYDNITVRSYEQGFATVCGVLKIKSSNSSKESTLGQLMNFRKENGKWKIYTLQATPLFNEIEEMEAYPIKFAENVLEKYRQQEQIAKTVKDDSLGIYRINLTKGLFEDSILKSDILIRTENGESYEKAMFDAAHTYLSGEEQNKFIRLFAFDNLLKCYNSGQTELSMEYRMNLSEDNSKWLKTIIRLYTDNADGNLKGNLYVIDIDDKKREELILKNQVELDSLTGLYNKKHTEIKISKQIKKISSDNPGALLMIDIDHFKSINDTYGHKEGDCIIKEMGECLFSVIDNGDIAGRVGGDEFCAFLQNKITYDIIKEKASMICQKVNNMLPQHEIEISCSIGIILCTNPDTSFDEIYQKADHALYYQKANGRNGYFIYDDLKL